MKLSIFLAATALLATGIPAWAQFYDYRGDDYAYDGPGYPYAGSGAYDGPRTRNGHIPDWNEWERTPWGYSVNGNADGNNLTRSNGQ